MIRPITSKMMAKTVEWHWVWCEILCKRLVLVLYYVCFPRYKWRHGRIGFRIECCPLLCTDISPQTQAASFFLVYKKNRSARQICGLSPQSLKFRIVCFCPRLMFDCDPLASDKFLVEIVWTKTEIVLEGVHKEDFSHRQLGWSELWLWLLSLFASSLNSVVARNVAKSFTKASFFLFSLSNWTWWDVLRVFFSDEGRAPRSNFTTTVLAMFARGAGAGAEARAGG